MVPTIRIHKNDRLSKIEIPNFTVIVLVMIIINYDSEWKINLYLALSDGYNPEREFGKTEGMTLPKPKGNYSHWSFLMTKKKLNPQPNFTDKFFIFLWKYTDVFIPLAGIVSFMK